MNFLDMVKPQEIQTVYAHPGEASGDHPVDSVAVSVIVPTYNDSRWLPETLQALYRLEAPPGGYEIILIDDGSTDDTAGQMRTLGEQAPCPFLALQLRRNRGRSLARNVGIRHARGSIVACTDADCLPDREWLMAALPHFQDSTIGMVQGQTLPVPGVQPPLLSHFMEVKAEDGHYATCNMLYRRQALLEAGGFDPSLDPNHSPLGTWEDVDLGWRVLGLGWRAVFEPNAVVYHQIIPFSLRRWLRWPIRMGRRPEITARYPGYRRFLYRGLWIDRAHAWLTLALLGLALIRIHPTSALLATPYLGSLWRRYGVSGRWPVVKLGLHAAWDLIGFFSLLARSIRFGTPVL